MNVSLVLQNIEYGIVQGALIALIALGYTMVYGIIELINFAHGDVFMMGTFVAGIVLNLLGANHPINDWGRLTFDLVLAGAAAMLFCGFLDVVIERIAYRPLRGAPRLAPLITAIGMSLILEDIAKLRFGSGSFPFPNVFPNQGTTIFIGAAHFDVNLLDIIIVTLAVVLMVALTLFISRTKTGRAMRSVAQDRDAASLMGVNVDRTIVLTFLIGGALAGAAAIMYGMDFKQTAFTIGFRVGLIAFTAAVLGGIGNIAGAMLGGMLIGMVPPIVDIIDYTVPGYQLSGWTDAIIFGVLILILIFRPSGLLGQQVADKV